MKNGTKLLAIIAIIAVMGFSMMACSSGDNSEPEPAKRITVTGFGEGSSGEYGIWIISDLNDLVNTNGVNIPKITAVGYGHSSGANPVTADLFIPIDNVKPSSTKWTGSGDYYIYFLPASSDGSFYTTMGFIYAIAGTPTKFNIKDEVTTFDISGSSRTYIEYNVAK
jgi:hypothetical protein